MVGALSYMQLFRLHESGNAAFKDLFAVPKGFMFAANSVDGSSRAQSGQGWPCLRCLSAGCLVWGDVFTKIENARTWGSTPNCPTVVKYLDGCHVNKDGTGTVALEYHFPFKVSTLGLIGKIVPRLSQEETPQVFK